MAKYPATKTLTRAIPTVRISDGVVKRWNIEVSYSHTNCEDVTWSNTYSHNVDVEELGKTATEFTKADLLGMMPEVFDSVFDSHYETYNTPPVEECDNDFDVDQLANE